MLLTFFHVPYCTDSTALSRPQDGLLCVPMILLDPISSLWLHRMFRPCTCTSDLPDCGRLSPTSSMPGSCSMDLGIDQSRKNNGACRTFVGRHEAVRHCYLRSLVFLTKEENAVGTHHQTQAHPHHEQHSAQPTRRETNRQKTQGRVFSQFLQLLLHFGQQHDICWSRFISSLSRA